MARPRLEVADIFCAHGAAWRKANLRSLTASRMAFNVSVGAAPTGLKRVSDHHKHAIISTHHEGQAIFILAEALGFIIHHKAYSLEMLKLRPVSSGVNRQGAGRSKDDHDVGVEDGLILPFFVQDVYL